MTFINIIAVLLLASSLYLIAADLFRIPTIKATKAMKSLSIRQHTGPSSLDIWLESFAIWLSRHLRLNEYKRLQLESDLRTANMGITPEMHIANAVVKAGIASLLCLPLVIIIPAAFPLIFVVAFVFYRQNVKSVSIRIQEKRDAIEFELPRLVFTIEKTLMHSRDLLAMLDSYRANAGSELKTQLDITTADMRSGNYESAITRLEARVGSAMLSDVCRGLQGILRGDDTTAYWASLSVKFADNQRQLMKKKALKAPDKVKRLSMCLLFCFMLIYIVVIVKQIIDSMGIMFG